MIICGIDSGAKTVKVVILKNGHIIGKSILLVGMDSKEALGRAFEEALKQARISQNDIESIGVTGVGKKEVPFAKKEEVTEVMADAKGATFLFPSARLVIDVGAEEGRAMRCDPRGKVADFAINEKCAAGAGTFTEAMARALEVEIEELGALSLKSTKAVPMNAQCAVFAESEMVSLIHAKIPKPDLARSVHDAIADRIIAMVRRVGIERDIVLIGGMAKNPGFAKSLKEGLESEILIPENPEFVGALGAALVAADQTR